MTKPSYYSLNKSKCEVYIFEDTINSQQPSNADGITDTLGVKRALITISINCGVKAICLVKAGKCKHYVTFHNLRD